LFRNRSIDLLYVSPIQKQAASGKGSLHKQCDGQAGSKLLDIKPKAFITPVSPPPGIPIKHLHFGDLTIFNQVRMTPIRMRTKAGPPGYSRSPALYDINIGVGNG
jgi:hypothetical protein